MIAMAAKRARAAATKTWIIPNLRGGDGNKDSEAKKKLQLLLVRNADGISCRKERRSVEGSLKRGSGNHPTLHSYGLLKASNLQRQDAYIPA